MWKALTMYAKTMLLKRQFRIAVFDQTLLAFLFRFLFYSRTKLFRVWPAARQKTLFLLDLMGKQVRCLKNTQNRN